jgi:DNA-binding response OmpR family regulator
MVLLPHGQAQHLYEDQHLAVNFQAKHVVLDGHPMILRKKEYELLAMLVEYAGEVVARETLLDRIWGYNNQVRTRTLDVHIRRLRLKLGRYADRYIETIFGVGYRFQPIGLRGATCPDSSMAALA